MAYREVSIQAKVSGKKEDLIVTPTLFQMKGTGWGEQIRWTASGRITAFTIMFNYAEGSPFGGQNTFNSVNNVAVSPVPTVSGKPMKPFAYRIIAQLKQAGKHRARQVDIDPEVEIDDTTPPPAQGGGGGKKAARKAGTKKVARKKTGKRRPPKRR